MARKSITSGLADVRELTVTEIDETAGGMKFSWVDRLLVRLQPVTTETDKFGQTWQCQGNVCVMTGKAQ